MYNRIELKDFDFKLLQLQNNFYNLAIEQTDFILSVFKKWNNKKITKRIENDLNKNDKNITFYCYRESNYLRLYIYCENDTYCYGADKNGIDKIRYIKDRKFNYVYSYDLDYVDYEKLKDIITKNVNYFKELMIQQKEILPDIEKRIANINCLLIQLEAQFDKIHKLNDCYIGAYKKVEFSI